MNVLTIAVVSACSAGCLMCCGPSKAVASGITDVYFTAATRRMGNLEKRRAEGEGRAPPKGTPLIGYLSIPDGKGRFPAVLILHGCGGNTETRRRALIERVVSWGYVALAVDSFATRPFKNACVSEPGFVFDRVLDAIGAIQYLAVLPSVDTQNIAVLGYSQGGSVALDIVTPRPFELQQGKLSLPRAVVAYYPVCASVEGPVSIPALVMVGEADDWIFADDCRKMAARSAGGSPLSLITYPGAFHDFDNPGLRNGINYFGHWLKYDQEADAKATSATLSFLQQQFGR